MILDHARTNRTRPPTETTRSSVQRRGFGNGWRQWTLATAAAVALLAGPATAASAAINVGTIPVGMQPSGVAITPDGSTVYVINQSDQSVSVVDVASGSVSPTTIPVGRLATGIAIHPDGRTAYVTNRSDGTVTVIDIDPTSVSANTAIGTISLGITSAPFGIAVAPDGTRAYVVNSGPSTLSVIDVERNSPTVNTVLTTIGDLGSTRVGFAGAYNVAVAPDSRTAYVSHQLDPVLYVVDVDPASLTANTRVAAVPIGPLARGLAVSAVGPTAFVGWGNTSTGTSVAVVDLNPASGTFRSVTAQIPVGAGPVGLAVTPDGSTVVVANQTAASVSVIDVAANTVRATLNVPALPNSVAITPDGNTAYVASSSGSSISVLGINDRVPQLRPASELPALAVDAELTFDTVTDRGNPEAQLSIDTGLPAGLTFDAATGRITGTPTTPGGYSFTVTATNRGGTSSVTYTGTVPLGPPPVLETPANFPTLTVGAPVEFGSVVYRGLPPATLTVSGDLPQGLTFDTATGIIAGTPTAAGSFSVTVSAVNGGEPVTATYTGTVTQRPSLASPAAIPPIIVGQAFAFTALSDPGNPPPTVSISDGALPAGLTLDPATGTITGTPRTAGPFAFTLTAANDAGETSVTYEGRVQAADIATPALPTTGVDATGMTRVVGLAMLLAAAGALMLSRTKTRVTPIR